LNPWPLVPPEAPPNVGENMTKINCTVSLAMSNEEKRERQLDAEALFEIDTGHDLMITEPGKVADILLQVAAARGRDPSNRERQQGHKEVNPGAIGLKPDNARH
jgi:hypothetical protein